MSKWIAAEGRQTTALWPAQVVAYMQVTPDHIPAKIYVEETTAVIRNLTAPLQGLPVAGNAAWQANCSDLAASMAAAAAASSPGDDPGARYQPSARDMAAVEDCLSQLGGQQGGNGTGTDGGGAGELGGVAVKLLQAFIDSNGCAAAHVLAAPRRE